MPENKELRARLEECERLIRELQNGMSVVLRSRGRLSRKEKRFSAEFLLENWQDILREVFFAVGQAPYDWFAWQLLRKEADGTEFTLVRPDGNFFALNKLLPPGCRFKAGQGFFFAPFLDTVYYDPVQLDQRGFLWSLLHEVGHARQGTSLSDLVTYLKEHFMTGRFGRFCSVGILDGLWKFRGSGERKASAYALEELKRLEESGFPVLDYPDAEDTARIFFDLALLTHMNLHLRDRAASYFALPALFDDLFVTGRLQLSFFSSRMKI